MLKLSVYLFHHTSFFAVCSTNSVKLGRKSVARKKKIDSGKTRLLCDSCTKIEALALKEFGPITKLSLELAL